ncbi:hypothetical protein Sjap_014484 [Stephania japonica]|uniref:FHA domain-containing protein n=1 Tax=Stephania japonica TaxID=461633 RepID=A0AAP0NQ03_9MAGN
MVWGLFPAESVLGEQNYFIFSKGLYKVGRKGCDVIINTDKGVSRIHAELVVNSMTSSDVLQASAETRNHVFIRDCSKYGTFINKKLGSGVKVHEHPNKEMFLKDGDLISFGTGNAVYRFCFVPLKFFVYGSKLHMNQVLQERICSIGAIASQSWSTDCTHVLVDEDMPVEEEMIDVVVAQKPVVLNEWLKETRLVFGNNETAGNWKRQGKLVSETRICNEIPSCSRFTPRLKLESLPVKVVDPTFRENCLAGYTFLLGSTHLYKYARLHLLLEAAGARTSEDDGSNRVMLVVSKGSSNQFFHTQRLRSLSRLNEVNLVSAALCGYLDLSVVEAPSIVVSSSCSTDETIVADSDVEMDTAATDHAAANPSLEETVKHEDEEEVSRSRKDSMVERIQIPELRVEDSHIIQKIKKADDLDTAENECSDIIYSQDLIMRDDKSITSVRPPATKHVREVRSGNSFKDLIPFSRLPFKDSDYGSEEVAEHIKKEKKRKQMEAIAEDLFNNDKGRRRGGGGSSIRELLSCG